MSDERLREHPSKRFAGPEHLIDLHREIEALRREPHQGTSRHRQKALYKHGPVSVSLFVFDQEGGLKDHVVQGGSVVIQVLEGTLEVKTPENQHLLQSGHLLLLAAGVVHSVAAQQPAGMLLTVHLDDPD
jgi:quercetin dioxygenase-like cupin family protein